MKIKLSKEQRQNFKKLINILGIQNAMVANAIGCNPSHALCENEPYALHHLS